jgi:hypothetical protein
MSELATRIEALEAECFALAANQCNHGYGDEHGHFRCSRIEALEAAARTALDHIEHIERDLGVTFFSGDALRAALAAHHHDSHQTTKGDTPWTPNK